MPSINVTERDLSWYYRQREPGQIVVLMPGVSTFGPYDPTLVTANNFARVLGEVEVDGKDLSYQMAKSFVKSGIDVLFWRQPLDGAAYAKDELALPDDSDKVKYDLLDAEPTDWSTNYKDYYERSAEEPYTYSHVTGATAPTWTANTYYKAHVILTIKAKYDGSFGNGLTIRVKKANDDLFVFVYRNNSMLENFTINLTDPSSMYNWHIVNTTTNYVEFIVNDMEQISDLEAILPDIITLTGGSDGTFDANAVAANLSSDNDIVIEGFNYLKDPLSYYFNVIIDGGFNIYEDPYYVLTANEPKDWSTKYTEYYTRSEEPDPSTGEYIYTEVPEEAQGLAPQWREDTYYKKYQISVLDTRYTDLAQSRGTAFYIVDGPGPLSGVDTSALTDAEYYAYTSLPQFNTSYATCFGAPVIAQLTSNGVYRELPASYAFLRGWAESLANGNPQYYAPAGVKRASLGFVAATVMDVTSATLDMWQNQEDILSSDGHKINPIMKLRNYGYVIYGNSTLLQNLADGSTSMLQSLSTRILCNMIKEQAFRISLTLQFDQIDNDLFVEFRTLMSIFMDQMRYGGALYDYEIVADYSELSLDDINNRTVPILIRISPNPAAEKFNIVLEISQAGVTFGGEEFGPVELTEESL